MFSDTLFSVTSDSYCIPNLLAIKTVRNVANNLKKIINNYSINAG